MNTNEVFEWIHGNQLPAFFIGCFLLSALGMFISIITSFFKHTVWAVRGVPANPPVTNNVTKVDCPCSRQCDWHEENDSEYE